MTDALRQALTILLVGMTTVFFILSVVVVVGNLLLSFLNSSNFVLNQKDTSHIPDDKEKALLDVAVHNWSGGKAKISGITKL